MRSSRDAISKRNDLEELFDQLGGHLKRDIQALVIGGAALLEYGMKDATKDIDIVCRTEADRDEFLRAARELGFELATPERRHIRLGLNRIAMRGGHVLDIFAGSISSGFGLSDGMWERAKMRRVFGKADVRYASPEDIFKDIFIMKLIAGREGDIEDCAVLVSAGLDFDTVYEEIESQYRRSGGEKEDDQKIWITYIEESIARLEEDYGISMPIADAISCLADGYREKLYQRLAARNGNESP